jgi:Cu+-exporting ATPase
VGAQTALAQIIKLVEEAQLTSAPIQRLADRVTAVFVPAVVLVAAVALFGWWLAGNFPLGLLSCIAVLIIACPCALGIATPAALMVGVGAGARLGILIRTGEVLERAEKLTTVVFDKTGTLTRGTPQVTDIVPLQPLAPDELLRLAAAVERGSEHPLGRAIVQAAATTGHIPGAREVRAIAGHGIEARVEGRPLRLGNRRLFAGAPGLAEADARLAEFEVQGKTAVLVGDERVILGIIALADTPKPEAKAAAAALRTLGVTVIMLSGDNRKTAGIIAAQVGIDEVIAEVLPEGKADVIAGLQRAGQVVAMVGDGINDAPALATADIGIAIGSGSDIAKETGGIVLVRDDVRDVVTAIRLSRVTLRKIRQNLFWAFIYNIVGVPVAALGLLNPMIAGAAMALSSLSVVGNSALLRRFRG